MKFKHSLQILIDNFTITFKLLVYRLIILLVFSAISLAIVIPFINKALNYSNIDDLLKGIGEFFTLLLQGGNGEGVNLAEKLSQTADKMTTFFAENVTQTALVIFGVVMIALIKRFINSIGNYTAAAVINDNMTLQAKSPFTITLIRNLGRSSLYSVMYVPLSFLWDAIFLTLGF